jgi:hypothetical protein
MEKWTPFKATGGLESSQRSERMTGQALEDECCKRCCCEGSVATNGWREFGCYIEFAVVETSNEGPCNLRWEQRGQCLGG